MRPATGAGGAPAGASPRPFRHRSGAYRPRSVGLCVGLTPYPSENSSLFNGLRAATEFHPIRQPQPRFRVRRSRAGGQAGGLTGWIRPPLNEAVAVGHLDLGQGGGVHDIGGLDNPVLHEDVGDQRVYLGVRE